MIYTYQDFLAVGDDEVKRMEFIRTAINAHKSSEDYKIAIRAQDYDARRNTTIMNYKKLLYTIAGQSVPDNYSANYKICSNFFNRFVTQQNQFLLGNGVSFEYPDVKDFLGGPDFDAKLQELGRYALVDKVSFGFWNYDHVEAFRFTEFVPLFDEEDGAMKAGIRFWQLDRNKPLRATLYELDGYTEYMWKDTDAIVLFPKRSYIQGVATSTIDGTQIYDYDNYPSFPIVPFWGNQNKQSELVGMQEQIDAYDLIKSGFANDLDDASQIYWTINNAGGMDDVDLVQFVQRMKTVKAAVVDDSGARAESHTMEVPYASRKELLAILRSDLYDDFMALDTKLIAGGATTATQILAAYEPLNSKADMYEYCVSEFIKGIANVAGVETGGITYTRSMIVNVQEEITALSSSAQYLSTNYITAKILSYLGDADKLETVLEDKQNEDINRAPIDLGEV